MALRSIRVVLLAFVAAAALPACAACPKDWYLWDPCPTAWGKRPAAAAAKDVQKLPDNLPPVTITSQPGDGAWAEFNRQGFMTVVNFRTAGEGVDVSGDPVVSHGMEYFHIPVEGANVTAADADALAKILAGSGNQRVLLYCSSGNRAAGVWAAYLGRHHGVSADTAVAAGNAAGISKDKVRDAVRSAIAAD